jgi:hypothetical protein
VNGYEAPYKDSLRQIRRRRVIRRLVRLTLEISKDLKWSQYVSRGHFYTEGEITSHSWTLTVPSKI